MARRLNLLLAGVAILVLACGETSVEYQPDSSATAPTVEAIGPSTSEARYPRPRALADVPLVELIAPATRNAGSAPVFEWRPVDGAAAYRLSVRGPDSLAWAWQGPGTSIRYGGVADGAPGPMIVPGMMWGVAALGPDQALVALSELRPVSPTDDPGPAPSWLHASPGSSAVSEPAPAEQPVAMGPCSLVTATEIQSSIKGTWGAPDGSAAVGIQGICSWTSINGSLLTLYVSPAEHYDPEGWGADETLSGLGDKAYAVTKGWDRRIGFVRGEHSVMLTIDFTKVDPDGFLELARLVEGRLP